MSRVELELYADRVARHAERLRDDVDGARLRLAWAGIEGRVRTELGAHYAGVLVAVDAAGGRRLLERGLRQLRALERMQALVERELAAAAGAQPSPVPFI